MPKNFINRGIVICGRFVFFGNNQANLESLGVVSDPPILESYNIAPGQDIIVIRPWPETGVLEYGMLCWPSADYDFENSTVNNTSVVLKLKLGKWNMILTGDAEEEVWTQVGSLLPNNIRFFKVPHHGFINGTDPDNPSSWYNRCSSYSSIGLSCDIRSTI